MNLTKPARQFACLVAVAGAASGAVTSVRVLGTTNTQAVLAYTAPDTTACTVEVSENAGYSPVVHDVNGTYFSGDNLDSRTGAISRGRERVVVIGKRTIERAVSGVVYSRALQAATIHYYRISCGGDTATGSFTTASVPFGSVHSDPSIPDPTIPGRAMQITPLFTRNATWIDPFTGALIKRMSTAQDYNRFLQINDAGFTSVLESANWTNPNNVLAVDSTNATYSGASCGGTCDWLKLTKDIGSDPGYEERLDVLRISINGSGNNATAANRTVEVCPVTLGATTIDAEGVCRDLILPQTTASKVTTSVSGLVDTWRVPGAHEITLVQAYTAGHFRFAIRKKNSTGTISIDAVRVDYWKSSAHTVGTGGALERCSPVARTDDDGQRYLCSGYTAGSALSLYSVHAVTGDTRFLGALLHGSFAIVADHHMWDATNPNVFYGQGSGDTDQFAFTYTGDGTGKSSGAGAEISAATLPNMTQAVKTFVTAHAGQYPFAFDDTKFNCGPAAVQGDYLMLDCARGAQDTVSWLGAYKISMQAVVAATPMFAAPVSRWCVNHTRDPAGLSAASMVTSTFGKDYYTGNGIYRSTLVGAINASTTSITTTSTCGGATCTGHVAGEPVSPNVADNYLMPAEVGDTFTIDQETVRITAKASATSWTIARGQNDTSGRPTTAASHADGAEIRAMCGNKPGAGPSTLNGSPMIIWNFLSDPYGMDSTGTHTWTNRYVGHLMSRTNVIVNNKSVAVAAEGVDLLSTVKDPAYTRSVQEAAWFAGKYAPGPGNTWQQHPAYHQVSAPISDRQFFWDIRPFVGGNLVTPVTPGCDPTKTNWPTSGGCAAARVAGMTKVYKMVVTDGSANPDGLNPKHYALWGVAKTSVLRDVSGPGSVLDDSAAKDYTFCYALIANECVTGSSTGSLYVQVPNLAVFYCTGGEGYAGGNDVCVSDFMFTGNALSQYGWANNKDGVDPAQITNPNLAGSAWTREIASHGLHLGYRLISAFTTGKPIPNGKWVVAVDWLESPLGRGLLALVKVPPIVKDTVNRSTFVPVPVNIGSVPKGTDNVVVEFGYAEQGTPSQFRCTSRAEECVAAGAVVNEVTPFYWKSESYTGLRCVSGCIVTLPLYPTRVAYYRVKYRDAGNNVLLAGPLEVAVAP